MRLPKSWQRWSRLSSLCINWLKLLMLCAFQVSYIRHTWLRDLWVCMFFTMGALQTHKLNSSWEQGSACDGERLQLWHSQWRCSSCSVGFHSQQSHKFTCCFKYLFSVFSWWQILVQAIGVAARSHMAFETCPMWSAALLKFQNMLQLTEKIRDIVAFRMGMLNSTHHDL